MFFAPNQRPSPFIFSWTIAFFLFGFLLNFQRVVGNVNFSFADFLIIPLFIYLSKTNTLRLEKTTLMFTLYVMLYLMIISLVVTPLKFQTLPDFSSVIIGIIKQCILFIYFFIGISLEKTPFEDSVIKGMVLGSFSCSILSFIFLLSGIPALKTIIIDSDRLIGFSNDPNFFAAVQCCALSLLLFSKTFITAKYRKLAVLAITLSILLSSSKTALVFMSVIYIFFIALLIRQRNIKPIILLGIIVGIGISTLIFFHQEITELVPGFQRIINLFENSGHSLDADGSSRRAVWDVALNMIFSNPWGFGNCDLMTFTRMFGGNNLAHNTYLQLGVEWGLFNAIFFIIVFIFILIYSIKNKRKQDATIISTILLLFSLTLSLNNSRLLWFIIGIVLIDYIDCTMEKRQRNSLRGDKDV